MKTKIKRHSRSVISVLLAVCMLVSCMTAGMIMTDAAKVDSGTVGGSDNTITDYFFKGSFDGWTNHYVNGRGEAFINIDTAGTYEFVVVTGGGTQRRANKTFTKTESYNTSQDEANFKIEVTTPGTYTFQTSKMNSGGSVTVSLTFPSGESTVSTDWRLVDGGCDWTHASSNKKFTLNSSTGLYEYSQYFTGNNYFRISDGTSQYNGNGGSSNVTLIAGDAFVDLGGATNDYAFAFSPSTAGTYIVRIDATNKKIRIEQATQYTVTCTTSGNGTLTSSLAQAYEGNSVTLTASPSAGYTLKSLKLTYNGTDYDVTNKVSNNKYTFSMPAYDVTAAAVFANSKTIYFNNYVTKWPKIFVYTENESGAAGNGIKPGQEMTRLGESSIYQIEIPADSTKIIFTGSGGTHNEGGTITCNGSAIGNKVPPDPTYNLYKATNTSSGAESKGTWSEYKGRSNVYTVTPGASVTGDNTLYYKGLSATLYDYYTDGEYNNGWITGIAPHQSGQRNAEYCVDNVMEYKWNPYKTLDKALSVYARSNTVTYPLYFGNLNIRDAGGNPPISELYLEHEGRENSEKLYHFYEKINNSVYLPPDGASVKGLAANSESDSTIYHSSGEEMVMFDEDWLSRENETGNPLATILHSTGFPVRKVTAPAGTVYPNKIYVDAKDFAPTGDGELWARFIYENNGDAAIVDAELTYVSSDGYWECSIPSGTFNKVIFVRQPSTNHANIDWVNYWNESNRYDIPTSTTDANRVYTFSAFGSGKTGCTFTRSNSNNGTQYAAYDYYEFDSTGGLDNAYIKDVNTGTNTATIEYSKNDKVWSADAGTGKSEGFFPFDNMTGNITNQNTGSSNVAHDLGFGMKLEIPFSINANGTIDSTTTGLPQTFNFSGDDDLWVFIDGKLVLDLGGAHKRAEGSIDFKNRTATSTTMAAEASVLTTNSSYYNATEPYSNSFNWFDNSNPDVKHTMTLYYMERGMYESNLKFDFSFHAISNLYTTEKKVRTSEVNSGFYEKNDNTKYGNSGITKFERSYQDENFTFDHKVAPYDEGQSGTYSYPTLGFTYSKEEVTWAETGKTTANTQQTYMAGNALNYALNNDEMTHFIGKFTSGDYFRLQETPDTANNHYNYTPRLTVYNDNDSTGKTTYDVTEVGEGAYTFEFSDQVSTGLETVNVRGQFENEMKTHDLTIRKSIGDNVDATTEFTFYIAFDVYIGNEATGYIPYPLFCTSDDTVNGTQINASGQFKLHGGQYITFHGIPEGIRFRIYEDISGITKYTYGSMSVIGGSSTAYESGNHHGVDMTMGTNDVNITTINNDNTVKGTIRVKYAPSYYDFEQGTNISQDTYTNTNGSYTNSAVVTKCETSFLDVSDTSTTEISADQMVETDTRNASKSFEVSVDKVNAGGKLFIGWYDEDGNRYNNDDATQHNLTASAAKDEDRIFEARFIDQPTYRIDYEVPTRLWGNRIYKVFGKVTNDMITDTQIGYDSTRTSTAEKDQKYYITGSMVEANKPSEEIFLKDITWASVDTTTENGKTTTQYKVGKKVTHNSSGDAESVTETGTVTYDLYRSTQATADDKQVTVDLYYDCSDLTTRTEQVTYDYGSSVKDNTVVAIKIPADKTFYRWKIETLDSLGGTGSDNKLVTYDYSKNFNYVVYDNYKVTAELLVKKDGKDYNPYSAKNPDDPYNSYAPSNTTSVINLGQTRSHWNDTTTGEVYELVGDEESTNNTNANYNYDRMFIDLALSYSDGIETKLNTVDNLNVGFIIQYWDGENWINWKTEEFSSKLLGDKNRIEYYYGFQNAAGNRAKNKFRVQPIIGGVASGTPLEFDFSASQFSAQTNY